MFSKALTALTVVMGLTLSSLSFAATVPSKKAGSMAIALPVMKKAHKPVAAKPVAKAEPRKVQPRTPSKGVKVVRTVKAPRVASKVVVAQPSTQAVTK